MCAHAHIPVSIVSVTILASSLGQVSKHNGIFVLCPMTFPMWQNSIALSIALYLTLYITVEFCLWYALFLEKYC